MKILQVFERFYPRVGGAENHVYNISKELGKLGHEVTVVTSTSIAPNDVRGLSKRGLSLHVSLPDLPPNETTEENVKICRFEPKLGFYTLLFTPGLIAYLYRHLREFDIVHVHGYLHAEPAIVAGIAKLKKKPFILTAHDLKSSYGGILGLTKKMADLTVGNLILNAASVLIALTPINRDEYLRLGAHRERIRIVPNAIRTQDFASLRDSDSSSEGFKQDKMVLFVGRFVAYKGAQHIIKAIKDIATDYPFTRFVFVGQDDGYLSSLIGLARSLAVYEKCSFLTLVSDTELRQLYANADVFILPSTCEAFGITALESMAAGTPVVLANAGGLSFLLSDLGGSPLDMGGDVPIQIAKAVKEIFRKGTHEDVENRRKRVLQEYSWSAVAGQLASIYGEVLHA